MEEYFNIDQMDNFMSIIQHQVHLLCFILINMYGELCQFIQVLKQL
jgi:hypothetical protein